MRYDTPFRELLREAVAEVGSPFTQEDVERWLLGRHGDVRRSAIRAHLSAGTVNNQSRVHFGMPVGDLVFRRSDGKLERYDPARHGRWRRGLPAVVPTRSASNGGTVASNGGAPSEPRRRAAPAAPTRSELRAAAHAAFGVPLRARSIPLRGGRRHRFDLVSADGRVVGAIAPAATGLPSTARLAVISERVWLLQQVAAGGTRFVLVLGDPRAATSWLRRFGAPAGGVRVMRVARGRIVDAWGGSRQPEPPV